MMKISKYKNLGKGWHSDSIRHSNARRYGKSDIVSQLNRKEIVVEKVNPKTFSQLPIVKMKEDEGYSVDAVSDIHNNPDKIEIKIKDSGNDEKNAMLLAHEFNEIEKFKKINKNGYKQGSEELAHECNNIKY